MKLRVAYNHQTPGPDMEPSYGIAVWAPPGEPWHASRHEHSFRLRFSKAGFFGGSHRVYTLPRMEYDDKELDEWAERNGVQLQVVSLRGVYERPDRLGKAVPIRCMTGPDGTRYGDTRPGQQVDMPTGELRVVQYVAADDIALLRETQNSSEACLHPF